MNHNSSNITAEVPAEQKIREMALPSENTTDTNTSYQVTDTEYTLSPVITVTKKETTLTKGDMKLQKVTVQEDISKQEMENGDHKMSYSELHTSVQTNKQTVTRTIVSGDVTETVEKEENKHHEKKSRIPQLKFRQTVEKVQKQRREQNLKEQAYLPRRSSIPKLKDPKLVKRHASLKHEPKDDFKQVKRQSSLNYEPKLKDDLADEAAQILDEFDKIYEEIIDDPQKEIDEKVLEVKIDDPEKVETKFEEIIHAYDSNDDSYFTPTEKIKLSKIPWRKKNDGGYRTIKSNQLASEKLRDGGFRVSATTITTKRFARGNSADFSDTQKVDIVELKDEPYEDQEVIEKIVTETIERAPIQTKDSSRGVKREISVGDADDIKDLKKIVASKENTDETIKVEEFEGGRKVTKETITRHNIKSGIPIKPERLSKSISKELNRRPAALDDRDYVNREVVKHESFKNGGSKTIIRETFVVKETPVKSEKITRGISRTFSRDGKSVTVSAKPKEVSSEPNKMITEDLVDLESSKTPEYTNIVLIKDKAQDIKNETTKTENNNKEVTKKNIPVLKTTHSYSKGKIQNVEMSKTIEWKPAEVRTKRYVRQSSENTTEISDKKFGPTVIKKETVIKTTLSKEHNPAKEEEIKRISKHTDEKEDTSLLVSEENIQSIYVPTEVSDSVSAVKELDVDDNDLKKTLQPAEILQEMRPYSKELEDNNVHEQDKDSDIPSVTILKGNVSRLITQISVKESTDIKKEIDVEEDLPKKKTVLSKIAMFEGKEPAEISIKIKKCVIDKKIPSTVHKENLNDVPKITHETQPKLDRINDIHEIEDGYNELRKEVTNEPIIVDQIWKVHDQTIQTVSMVHHIEDVKILPAVHSTVSENKAETVEVLPEKLEFDANITHHGNATMLPGKIDFSQNLFESINNKVANRYESVQTEVRQSTIATPAKIDFISSDYQNDVSIKYSPEKIEAPDNQNQTEIKKPKVGKLDLNFWQKQVEDNNKNVSKGKVTKNQTHTETLKIVPVTTVFEKSSSEMELPSTIEVKTEDSNVMPTIMPGKHHVKSHINQYETLKTNTVSNQRLELEVPVVLPQTPLTKTSRMDFETQQSHIDVPVIPPVKIDVTPNENKDESPTIVYESLNLNKNTTNAQMLPGRIDISIKQTQNESSEMITSKTDFNYNNYEVETAITLPDHTDFKRNENTIDNSRLLPGRIHLNPYENLYGHKVLNSTKQNIKADEININKQKEIIDDLDREIPSDPELVDSEPEIKEPKESIMHKLKNKIYFITHKNKDKPEDAPSVTTDTIENDTYISSNKVQNEDSDMASMEYDTRHNKEFDTKSEKGFEKSYKTQEEIRRAKSLAELDLGDVVKGQVQRMVYRIKSVDMDRADTHPSRKISVKEMPRKSSVLEKIALFEGKATSTRSERSVKQEKIESVSTKRETTTSRFEIRTSKLETRPPKFETRTSRLEIRSTLEERATTPVNASQISLNECGLNPETNYLQKVEDLSTAKIRYGKSEMLYLQLSNGVQMPAIALGTALLDQDLGAHIVTAAIDLGYRAIDTAYIYGTEKVVGEGIKTKMNDGTVTREELFIMSKLWSTFHRPDLVEKACRDSLAALGLDYFDLYMIHNPMSFKEGGDPIPKIASVLQFSEYDYLDAWFAMEKLVTLGLVKSIGVSNFNSQQIQRILDKGKIKPVVNQVECHPYLSQQRLQKFCMERNITLSCFGVLGSKGTPAAYKNSDEAVIDDPFIKVMASGLSVSPAQLLVRYQIQSGRNVVVKASSAAHLWDVLQALTFELEQHQIDAIHALNKGKRTFTLKGMGDTHKNYPFNEPF